MSNADHWTDYWASGALTSLPQDFRSNYDGEIAAFWHEIFRGAPHGASVLDACAGNGALALLAAEYSESRGLAFRITAVDAASIDPARVVATHSVSPSLVSSVSFIGNMPLQEWSAPSDSLDLIISQYGIEYCEQGRVAPRLSRMLKPGGRCAMLCHAPSTDMHATMQGEADDYARLEDAGIVRLLQSWGRGQIDAAALRQDIGRAASRLAGEQGVRRSPLLGGVLDTVRRLLAMSDPLLERNRAALMEACRGLELGQKRLEDMLRVHAVVSERDWYQPWLEAGLELERDGQLLYRGRHDVGRYYVFRQPWSP